MKIIATPRTTIGTSASRRLRRAGQVPGIVYGGKESTENIAIDHNFLWHALKKESFHSTILDMELAGKNTKVTLRDVHYHPYKPIVLHLDLQRVDADSIMTFKVPLHFNGEEDSEAVKIDHCLVNHIMTELEIACLPSDLPEAIDVDLSHLTKGQTIHIDDLKLPQGIKVLTHGQSNPVVASATTAKEEKSIESENTTNSDNAEEDK
jgi:large subunit ribosomal protein L25